MPPCKTPGCPGQLVWATSQADSNRHVPMDVGSEGNPDGKFAVSKGEKGQLLYRSLKRGEQPGEGEVRMVSHYATCTRPQQHSRKGKKR